MLTVTDYWFTGCVHTSDVNSRLWRRVSIHFDGSLQCIATH